MSIHQNQLPPTHMSYGSNMNNFDQEKQEPQSYEGSESNKDEYDWADVLNEVEPYY